MSEFCKSCRKPLNGEYEVETSIYWTGIVHNKFYCTECFVDLDKEPRNG